MFGNFCAIVFIAEEDQKLNIYYTISRGTESMDIF